MDQLLGRINTHGRQLQSVAQVERRRPMSGRTRCRKALLGVSLFLLVPITATTYADQAFALVLQETYLQSRPTELSLGDGGLYPNDGVVPYRTPGCVHAPRGSITGHGVAPIVAPSGAEP